MEPREFKMLKLQGAKLDEVKAMLNPRVVMIEKEGTVYVFSTREETRQTLEKFHPDMVPENKAYFEEARKNTPRMPRDDRPRREYVPRERREYAPRERREYAPRDFKMLELKGKMEAMKEVCPRALMLQKDDKVYLFNPRAGEMEALKAFSPKEMAEDHALFLEARPPREGSYQPRYQQGGYQRRPFVRREDRPPKEGDYMMTIISGLGKISDEEFKDKVYGNKMYVRKGDDFVVFTGKPHTDRITKAFPGAKFEVVKSDEATFQDALKNRKPREFRPRREGEYQQREYRPRREGEYKPREYKPRERREADIRVEAEGEKKPRQTYLYLNLKEYSEATVQKLIIKIKELIPAAEDIAEKNGTVKIVVEPKNADAAVSAVKRIKLNGKEIDLRISE